MIFFSSNLVALRKEKGLNQEDLADLVGISRATVSDYERRRSEPDLQTLLKLAEFFGTSVDYLLRDANQYPKAYKQQFSENEIQTVEEPGVQSPAFAKSVAKKASILIPLVPVTLYANYLSESRVPAFIEKLPTLSLPFLPGGTYRAFEVADYSMAGEKGMGFNPGDVVIGEYVKNPHDIVDEHVYILVNDAGTVDPIVLKRCVNRLDHTEKKIWCKSDNKDLSYTTFPLTLAQLKEVWQFKWKITAQAPDISTVFERLNNLESRLQEMDLKYQTLVDKKS